MATATEHGEVVLAGILPHRKDNLEKALRRLTPEHFQDRKQANLFTMLEKYHDTVNSVLPRQYLDDLLKTKVDESQYLLYMETFDQFANTEVPDSEFLWSIEQLRELAAERATGETIAEAMEILRKGKEVKPGLVLQGHEDARLRLLDGLSSIDRELHQSEAPEGLVQDEKLEIIEEYAQSKHKREVGEVQGIGFGIENLDAKTGGMQRGDLVIVAASSSNGKSSVAVQSAWYAATHQKKNVIFFATETGRVQTRRKIIARHSKLPMFELSEGLNTRNIKEGSLTPKEEQKYLDVVHDLTSNPEYGKIYLAQVHRGASIASLEQKIQRISRNFEVDFVVMDYLALLEGTQRNQEDRSKYVNTLREAKMVANSVADGLGVPFLSPWQMSRDGRKSADTSGYYDMSNLSDTSEAEKIADLVISLYRSNEDAGRYAEVQFQILKNRDGERANDILADADYATSTFTAKNGMQIPRALTSPPSSSTTLSDAFSLDGLLD